MALSRQFSTAMAKLLFISLVLLGINIQFPFSYSSRESKAVNNENKDETVHIVMMLLSRAKLSTYLSIALESLFRKTRRQVNLHLVVDNVTLPLVSVIKERYESCAVSIVPHDTVSCGSQIAWIEDKLSISATIKYSKLTLVKILPQDLKRVIYLDFDIFVRRDIGILWDHFRNFNETNTFGLAPEIFDSYKFLLPKWTILKRGFNSGVMLIDLEKLRLNKWMDVWPQILQEERANSGYKRLYHCDQDVLNTVLARHPDWLYELPCSWNSQVNQLEWLSKHCPDVDSAHLIHMAGPIKFDPDVWTSDILKNIKKELVALMKDLKITNSLLQETKEALTDS